MDTVKRDAAQPGTTDALQEVRRAAQAFVSFVDNNLPHLEPHEVKCLFGHLEWDELRAALKETE